jgi:hypothetical protein
MGTRALIHIKGSTFESHTLVTIYRQYDGYPSGLGKDIYEALHEGKSKIVNGIGKDTDEAKDFNGMGCLAAQLIGKLKNNIGNVYIYPIDSKNVNEEFTYTLFEHKGSIMLQIDALDECIQQGPLHAFDMTKLTNSLGEVP